MAIQRPTGKYLNPGSNSNKMNKALQKPKITIVSSSDKTYMENQRLEKMNKGLKTTTATSKSGVKATASVSGTRTKPVPNLPKSTKMSESAKKVKITGSATGTKTPTAAKSNAMTKNGKKINSRAGGK